MRRPRAIVLTALLAVGSGSCSSATTSTPQTDFCALVSAFKATNDALGDVVGDNPSQARDAMKRIIAQVEVLQQRAPANMKVDVDAVAGYLKQFDSLLASVGYDLASASGNTQLADDFAALNSDELNAARERLANYTTVECGASSTSTTSP